jgi:EmrB/QacA subfamily drug resistance transporter
VPTEEDVPALRLTTEVSGLLTDAVPAPEPIVAGAGADVPVPAPAPVAGGGAGGGGGGADVAVGVGAGVVGVTEVVGVGVGVAVVVGDGLGDGVGEPVGEVVGVAVGVAVGDAVGEVVGSGVLLNTTASGTGHGPCGPSVMAAAGERMVPKPRPAVRTAPVARDPATSVRRVPRERRLRWRKRGPIWVPMPTAADLSSVRRVTFCRACRNIGQKTEVSTSVTASTTAADSAGQPAPPASVDQAPPSAAQPDPDRWWTLVAVCLGTFMLLVDITIINVALPDIQQQLGASFSDLQWVIDAYALTLASLLLTSGSLADLYGRRKLYITGLGLFTLASLICGVSTSPLMLILARGVQGIGGAIMFSVSLALLAGAFSGRERGVAFGVWGAITGLAVAIGPLLGGALTSGLSWRWIFFVNLPLGLGAMALTRAKVSESVQRGARRPDWAGFVVFTAALSLLVFGLIRSSEKGWGSLQVLVPLAATVVLLIVFVAVEFHGRQPMFDLKLFKLPTFLGGSLVAFSLSASLFALQLYLVLYLQDVLGYSAFGTGVRLLVLSGGILLTSTLAGRLTSHVPVRFLVGPGLLLVGIGLLLMRRLDPTSDWTRLIPGLFIAGVGTGLVNPPLASTAVGVVEPARSGMASGINSTFRQVGIATGIALFGSLFAAKVTAEVAKGLAGAPPQAAAGLSNAVKNGAGKQAIAALPEQLRPIAARVARESFVVGLREIILVAAVVALVGGVLGLLLVRGKDFVGPGAQADPTPEPTPDAPPAAPPARPKPSLADWAGAVEPATQPGHEPADEPPGATTDELPVLEQAAADPLESNLFGRLEHTDGRPFHGVPLTVTTGDGEPVDLVLSGADGQFALTVEPGSYIVIASPPGCQPDARRAQVPTRGAADPVDFVLDGDALLYGRVAGATGGVLTLLDASGSVIGGADIEPDGTYEIAGLRGGRYTVTAMVPGTVPVAEQVEVLSGDAREHDLGLGPAAFEEPAERSSTSEVGLGLHPVAMVRGGTGISGLPSVPPSANGDGVASNRSGEDT